MEVISYCARANWAGSMENLLSLQKSTLSFHLNSDSNQ